MGRILVVDDSAGLRALYRAEFEAEGHDVLVCGNFEEAASIARVSEPDVIVADIMPAQDSRPLADLLRNNNGRRAIFLVINTDYDSAGLHPLAQWAQAVLLKSPDLGPLKGKVRRLLARGWFGSRLGPAASCRPPRAEEDERP